MTVTRCAALLMLALGLASSTGCQLATAEEYMVKGRAHLEAGRALEAIVEFRNATLVDSRYGEAHFLLAQSYEETRDYGKAAQAYVTAGELLPAVIEAQIKSASMLLIGGQFETARQVAERALRRAPRNVVVQVLHANAMAGLKQSGAALAAIQKAIALDPTRGETYGELALFQLAIGSPEQAEENLKKAVEALPNSAQTHLTLASFYWAQGRMPEAEAELKISAEVEPENFIGSRALATFYLGSNRADEAERHLRSIAESANSAEARLALADYYITLDRMEEATALLDTVALMEGGYGDARSRLAALAYSAGRIAEAHGIIDETLEKRPRHSRAILTKAQFFLVEKRMAEGIAQLMAAVAADERSIPAHFSLGTAYAANQQPELAAQQFNEILRISPQSVPARVELAHLYMATGQHEIATDYARQVFDLRPQSIDSAFLLARAHAARGEVSHAEEVLHPFLHLAGERADILALVGGLNLARGEPDLAREFFQQGQRADPDSMEPLEGLVTLEIRAGNLRAARTTAEQSLAQRPNDARLLILAARAYAASDDAERTEATLRKAIAADPTDTVAYDMLGQLYASQRKLTEALQQYEQLIRLDPRSVTGHTMTAFLMQSLDRKEEAKERYEHVLQLDPQAAVAAGNLAWLYVEQDGNLDIALQLAQVAKNGLPEQPDVNDTLAWIYYLKDLPEMALPNVRIAIEKDPNNATYQHHLGLIYLKTGDLDLAKSALQKALALDPEFEGAGEAEEALSLLY